MVFAPWTFNRPYYEAKTAVVWANHRIMLVADCTDAEATYNAGSPLDNTAVQEI